MWRAAEQMWKAARRRGAPRGVTVRIAKRIPMEAGLGGGSSDAAAALRALAALWRVKLTRARLHRMAAAIGADVPYFLEGGTALGLDRGDRLSPLADMPRAWVVLVVARLRRQHQRSVRLVGRTGQARREGREGQAGRQARAGQASNDLQAVVAKRHPIINRLVAALKRGGASHASLSGSGSAVFGLFTRKFEAERAARTLAGRRRKVFVTRTLGRAEGRRLAAK